MDIDMKEQTARPAPAGSGGFLRMGRMQELLGNVCRSTVYEMVKTQGLPAPIQLGSTRLACWDAEAVYAWIAAKTEAARQAKTRCGARVSA
jgi:predicted DNA-binding transcriptional regulator AlpA